ncbi:MAG: NAD-dependent epimerase/dehydratase family protein [Spirochaetota bacterium]
MIAFVTGAPGFIGFHLVRKLLSLGWQVRCLIRNAGERGALIAELGAGFPDNLEVIDGDLSDLDALKKGVDGADVVYHLAGTVIAVDKIGYFRTNFDGTVNLVNALVGTQTDGGGTRPPATPPGSGAPRLVFAGSLAAGGPNPPGRPRTEGDPDQPITHYGRSKLAAEEYILEHRESLWSAILRPAAVYGPRDPGFVSIFRAVSRGIRVGYLGRDTELSLIYVENLVQAMMAVAETSAPSGEVYYAADPPIVTVDAFQKAIATVLGKRTLRLPLPRVLVLLAALVATGVQRITRKPSFFNLQKVKEAVQPAWSCSAAKLRKATGATPEVDFQSGIRRTVADYRRTGVL